jgi:SOS-response transcriptional repressor LexA
MTLTLIDLPALQGDHVLKVRGANPGLGFFEGDYVVVKERAPEHGEVTVALVDGKATLGRHPVKDASKTLGVIVGLVRDVA